MIGLMLLFATFSCNNDDVTAPPITAENTFSCKINGKLFVPEDHGGFPVRQDGIILQFSDDNSWTFIFGNGPTDVYIHITDVTSTGFYRLGLSDGNAHFFQETENLMEADIDKAISQFGNSHISTLASGSVEVIELEVGKRIVLRFDEIKLVNLYNPNETAILTEGKLNINRETLGED